LKKFITVVETPRDGKKTISKMYSGFYVNCAKEKASFIVISIFKVGFAHYINEMTVSRRMNFTKRLLGGGVSEDTYECLGKCINMCTQCLIPIIMNSLDCRTGLLGYELDNVGDADLATYFKSGTLSEIWRKGFELWWNHWPSDVHTAILQTCKSTDYIDFVDSIFSDAGVIKKGKSKAKVYEEEEDDEEDDEEDIEMVKEAPPTPPRPKIPKKKRQAPKVVESVPILASPVAQVKITKRKVTTSPVLIKTVMPPSPKPIPEPLTGNAAVMARLLEEEDSTVINNSFDAAMANLMDGEHDVYPIVSPVPQEASINQGVFDGYSTPPRRGSNEAQIFNTPPSGVPLTPGSGAEFKSPEGIRKRIKTPRSAKRQLFSPTTRKKIDMFLK